MTRTATTDPARILRRLQRELQTSIRLLVIPAARSPQVRGQLEALRYVETFLRNQQPKGRTRHADPAR